MPAKFRVKTKDKGYKRYVDRARKLTKPQGVTVGIHADDGAQAHASRDDAKGAPATLLDVAIWNEFGYGVPERSFIRGWFDAAEPENMALAQRMLNRILKGELELKTALEQMGQKFVGQIQKRIAEGIAPANSPATIAQKGSSTPLIDTGQLRQGLTYKASK